MKTRPGCPTCGDTWGAARARVTRGRIVRVPESRTAFLRHGRFWIPTFAKKGTPGSSIRVNWPVVRIANRKSIALCPDPYHDRQRTVSDPAKPEPYAGLNRHAEDLKSRRKTRARRHRDRQGKGRR